MAEFSHITEDDRLASLRRRFDLYHIPEPNSGCWLWFGSITGPSAYGYGSMWNGVGYERSSHISWKMFRGHLPDRIHVLHKCDTPACVNPDHLFIGTDADNCADKMSKGRHVPVQGVMNGRAKFTEDDVRRIRADTRPQAEIAADYGVKQPRISSIQTRRTWRHI